jgi:protocatechuate 3,4-dioxygenase beta subunit
MARTTPLLLLVALTAFSPLRAQDAEFIRALERAQTAKPASPGSTARIAPESEPGTPLVVHGRVFEEDGRTPVAGATVFAYHTDREGLYDRAGAPAHSWRLRGWAVTDPRGGFVFQTIRPGAYPSRSIPAHIHFTVFRGDSRYHAGELRFEDDTLVRDNERTAAARNSDFAGVRPVRVEGSTQHVDFWIRLAAAQRF